MKGIIREYNMIMDNAGADHLVYTDAKPWSMAEMIANMECIFEYYTDPDGGAYIEAHESIPDDERGDQKKRLRQWQEEKAMIEKFIEKYK